VFEVGREHHWAIEQDLLGLGLSHLVTPPVLIGIARIPLEPLETAKEFVEDTHEECI
jgi:hypothetical protein